MKVEVYDPIADPILVKKEYEITLIKNLKYEAVILAVAHQVFIEKGLRNIKIQMVVSSTILSLFWTNKPLMEGSKFSIFLFFNFSFVFEYKNALSF